MSRTLVSRRSSLIHNTYLLSIPFSVSSFCSLCHFALTALHCAFAAFKLYHLILPALAISDRALFYFFNFRHFAVFLRRSQHQLTAAPQSTVSELKRSLYRSLDRLILFIDQSVVSLSEQTEKWDFVSELVDCVLRTNFDLSLILTSHVLHLD